MCCWSCFWRADASRSHVLFLLVFQLCRSSILSLIVCSQRAEGERSQPWSRTALWASSQYSLRKPAGFGSLLRDDIPSELHAKFYLHYILVALSLYHNGFLSLSLSWPSVLGFFFNKALYSSSFLWHKNKCFSLFYDNAKIILLWI